MSNFKLSKAAKDWFAPAFKEHGPMKWDFDKYYLCLLIGFHYAERAHIDGVSPGFVDNWINDYSSTKELILGLLLASDLRSMGIGVEEKHAVQERCRSLFTQNDMTLLTPEGMALLDSIAHGGFKRLAESFADNDRPRSQFQLLTHVAELLTQG